MDAGIPIPMDPERLAAQTQQIQQWVWLAAAAVSVLAGAMNTFFGYRIFRLLIAMWGFIIGALGGAFVGLSGESLLLVIIGGIVGAVLGIVVMLLLYYVIIFLLGASVGFLAAAGLIVAFHLSPHSWISLPLALGGGVMAVLWQRILIIVGTSFVGSANVVWGVFTLAGRNPQASRELLADQQVFRQFIEANWEMIAAWAILSAAGIVVQHTLTSKRKPTPA
ncbi:MAG: TMEM198/TM7SF3 family protein [Planctomycetes bacterium]|nr:TMEM198/TM7SF3 family protein [Planctomycetota bacterium]